MTGWAAKARAHFQKSPPTLTIKTIETTLSMVSEVPTGGHSQKFNVVANVEPFYRQNEISITEARLNRFFALGLPDNISSITASRLIERDREGGDRRLCLECKNLRGWPERWRCGNHAQAGLGEPALPGEWPLLFQRCGGFQ